MNVIEMIPLGILTVVLTIAVVTDIRSYRIPNWLTFPSMILGICCHSYIHGWHGTVLTLEGLILGFCVFLPFYLATGMGAGDLKLMGVVGAFLGPGGVFLAFIATAIVGGIYAVILLAVHGFLKETITRYGAMFKTLVFTQSFLYVPPEKKEKKPVMAYGVAIALGTLFSVYFNGVVFK